MPTFSQRDAARHYCQSWKDLTTEEMAEFFAEKHRAVCHLNKGHVGDHEDKILELAWSRSNWPRAQFYPAKLRPQPGKVTKQQREALEAIEKGADR